MKTNTTEAAVPVTEIVLKHPFTSASGVRIERLTLRRAKRADLRASHQYSKEELDRDTFMFARLTGLTMEDIDNLDLEDNDRLVRRFRDLHGGADDRSGDVTAG